MQSSKSEVSTSASESRKIEGRSGENPVTDAKVRRSRGMNGDVVRESGPDVVHEPRNERIVLAGKKMRHPPRKERERVTRAKFAKQ